MNTAALPTFGSQLREWRQRRRLSQLDLAGEAEARIGAQAFLTGADPAAFAGLGGAVYEVAGGNVNPSKDVAKA